MDSKIISQTRIVIARGASDVLGHDRHEALTGTLAVSLGIFGGKWGAYIGAPPIFLTDLLITIAVFHFAASSKHRSASGKIKNSGGSLVFIKLLLIYICFRFAFGTQHDATALRDFAPYLYAMLALFAASSLKDSDFKRRERTVQLLVWALTAHSVWCVATKLFPPLNTASLVIAPAQGTRLFHIRPDFDMAIVGVYTAYLLLQLLRGNVKYRHFALGWMLICWSVILYTQSRAGMLGAGTATLYAFMVVLGSKTDVSQGDESQRNSAMKLRLLASVPCLLIVAVLVLPYTVAGDRLVGDPGEGTKEARSNTWTFLWDYSSETHERQLIGVGFGPNFMADSGAMALLVGYSADSETLPRSPHNFWVGSLLRLGLIGLSLLLMMLIYVVVLVLRMMPAAYDDPLLFIASALVLALILPATFGVVLESPFGAVPWFWCIGIVAAARDSRKSKQIGDATAREYGH